jgi:hypothetical protein
MKMNSFIFRFSSIFKVQEDSISTHPTHIRIFFFLINNYSQENMIKGKIPE